MELKKQRNAAAALVPESLLKRYEKLRPLKQGIAIAGVVDGNTCGGCRMGLPSSVVGLVHEGSAVILCDNCERMLVDKR
jgi:predicted  nucleic acid-binding Zn-ribbon protein